MIHFQFLTEQGLRKLLKDTYGNGFNRGVQAGKQLALSEITKQGSVVGSCMDADIEEILKEKGL